MEQLSTAVIVAPFVITMVGFAVAIAFAPAVPNEIAPATGHDHDSRQLASVGPNVITREGRPSVLRELWGRAKNPLNALLLSLATVSYFLGDIPAAIVIAIMVILAITTAFVQEHRSNDAAAKLRAMVKTTASVKRRGACPDAGENQSNGFSEISIERLVPGDIVLLSAGDMIPADLRLLSTKDLFINQSAPSRSSHTASSGASWPRDGSDCR